MTTPLHAAVRRPLHIVHDAAAEAEDLRTEIALHDLPDRRFIHGGDGRHARLDAVHARFRQLFGNPDFIILAVNNPRLLLPVAQGDVVDPHLLGRIETLRHLLQVVPGTDEPVIRLPGGSLLIHLFFHTILLFCFVDTIGAYRSPLNAILTNDAPGG